MVRLRLNSASSEERCIDLLQEISELTAASNDDDDELELAFGSISYDLAVAIRNLLHCSKNSKTWTIELYQCSPPDDAAASAVLAEALSAKIFKLKVSIRKSGSRALLDSVIRPASYKNLSSTLKVVNLDIDFCPTPDQADATAEWLSSMTSLEKLKFREGGWKRGFRLPFFTRVFERMSNHPQQLELGLMYIDSAVVGALARWDMLTRLTFNCCLFFDDLGLHRLTQLQSLDVSQYEFGGIQCVPFGLPDLLSHRDCRLVNLKMDCLGSVVPLFQALTTNTSLERLKIHYCNFTEEAFKALIACISNPRSQLTSYESYWEKLEMDKNSAQQMLVNAVKNNTKLESFETEIYSIDKAIKPYLQRNFMHNRILCHDDIPLGLWPPILVKMIKRDGDVFLLLLECNALFDVPDYSGDASM